MANIHLNWLIPYTNSGRYILEPTLVCKMHKAYSFLTLGQIAHHSPVHICLPYKQHYVDSKAMWSDSLLKRFRH